MYSTLLFPLLSCWSILFIMNPSLQELQSMRDHALLCQALKLPVLLIPLKPNAMLKLMVRRALGVV